MQVRTSIQAIQQYAGESTESMVNALRYSSKHVNDADTPKQVKQLLGIAV